MIGDRSELAAIVSRAALPVKAMILLAALLTVFVVDDFRLLCALAVLGVTLLLLARPGWRRLRLLIGFLLLGAWGLMIL